MAFSGSYLATSFKQELLTATHNFTNGTHSYKLALFSNSATLDATTTAYTTSGEVTGSGYSAGGNTLTTVTPTTSGTTAFVDFADTSFSNATITARGALIYNSTQSNKAVAVIDFGSDKAASAGTFSVIFPTADANNAIIRIA